jgi:hypothetical protein
LNPNASSKVKDSGFIVSKALSKLAPFMRNGFSIHSPVIDLDYSPELVKNHFKALHLSWSPFIFSKRVYFNSLWFEGRSDERLERINQKAKKALKKSPSYLIMAPER